MQADSKALNKTSEEFKALPTDQIFSKVSKANVRPGIHAESH